MVRLPVLSDDSPADTSAKKVFGVVELLEQILLSPNISRLDLFVTQRVDTSFSSTIRDSQKLQAKLFDAVPYKPCFVEHPSWYERSEDFYPLISSLIPVNQFQLLPFNFPYMCNEYPGLPLAFFAPAIDSGKTIGWQGSTIVHQTGSWRKIMLGVAKGKLLICVDNGIICSGAGDPVPEGGTLGDLFDRLEKVRAAGGCN